MRNDSTECNNKLRAYMYYRNYESEKGNRHSLPLPGNRVHLSPDAPPPPDGTEALCRVIGCICPLMPPPPRWHPDNRSRQCKSVSAVQCTMAQTTFKMPINLTKGANRLIRWFLRLFRALISNSYISSI